VLTGYLSLGDRPGSDVTLDRVFYSLLLVTGRIRDIGQNVYGLLLVTGRIRDIGQNVLQSSFGNWAKT